MVIQSRRRPFRASTKRVLSTAREVARRAGHPFVGTGHFLVAMALVDRSTFPDPGAAAWLEAVLLELIHESGALAERWGRSARFTQNAREALRRAAELTSPRASVGPEHLLEAIRDAEGSTGAILYRRYAGRRSPGLDRPRPATEWAFLRGLGASDRDVLAGAIRRAIVTGVLPPGERMLPVRELASRLGWAAGTVAAAYRTLQTEGALVAQGRRGTYVALDPPDPGTRGIRIQEAVEALEPDVVKLLHRGVSDQELHEALAVVIARLDQAGE